MPILQCRFCLAEVEDDNDDGIIECECGARFPVLEALFSSGIDWGYPEDCEDESDCNGESDCVDLEF